MKILHGFIKVLLKGIITFLFYIFIEFNIFNDSWIHREDSVVKLVDHLIICLIGYSVHKGIEALDVKYKTHRKRRKRYYNKYKF